MAKFFVVIIPGFYSKHIKMANPIPAKMNVNTNDLFEIKDCLTREITKIILNSISYIPNNRFLFQCRIKMLADLIEIEKSIRKDFINFCNSA